MNTLARFRYCRSFFFLASLYSCINSFILSDCCLYYFIYLSYLLFSEDNDSKHKSKSTQNWIRVQGLTESVMTTPASSPDLNPIENVWSALKGNLRCVVKPKTKDQLVDGIVNFWESLTAEQCGKYIDHVHRVIPHVILNRGGPTNF